MSYSFIKIKSYKLNIFLATAKPSASALTTDDNVGQNTLQTRTYE